MEGFVQPQNLIKDKLHRLGFNLDELNVDFLLPVKLTEDEMDSGLVKSYYGDFTDLNEIFSNVIIQEFKDRTKIGCLLRYDINEKKIREIVDLFYSYFGLDMVFRGTTNQKDIELVEMNNIDLPLREWIYDDYVLRLKTDIKESLLMFCIVRTEKLKIFRVNPVSN